VREKLDDGAMLFIDALQGCHPQADRYTAACAYIWFNASLLKFLIGSRRLLRLARTEPAAQEQPIVAPAHAFSPTFSLLHSGARRPDGRSRGSAREPAAETFAKRTSCCFAASSSRASSRS
jgi:hypothetical protein